MAAGKLELKTRIRSIESTKKITKAMQLVAASKLKKQRTLMEENKTYAFYMKDTMEKILSSVNRNHIYTTKNEGIPFTIVITSDMGLCGGYNANVYRFLKNLEGEFAIIGSRGNSWCKTNQKQVTQSLINIEDDIAYDQLARLIHDVNLAS